MRLVIIGHVLVLSDLGLPRDNRIIIISLKYYQMVMKLRGVENFF